MVRLEIITPDGPFVDQEVEMVILPGSEGDFGVMEGHMPLTAGLRGGSIVLFSATMSPQQWYVLSGGIADIVGTHCRVLCEHIVALDATDALDVSPMLQPHLADARASKPYVA